MKYFPNLVESLQKTNNDNFIVCDFSPPKSGISKSMELATLIHPDMFSVSYNPGRSVKMNPVFASFWIQDETDISSVFTLSTKDMNEQALQGLLLGAQMLGLTSVIFVMGDTPSVNSISTTVALELTKKMNQGLDFDNNKLEYPTNFCIGSTFDISRNWDEEVILTQRKIHAGSDFLFAQAQFDILKVEQFLEYYRKSIGTYIDIPILWGVQMMMKGSKSFTSIPDHIEHDLRGSRSSLDITLDIIKQYNNCNIDSFYLLPPFFKNGRRDYALAQELISLLIYK